VYLHGYASARFRPDRLRHDEYRKLVDQFYKENGDLVTPAIYRACRENYEFFMTMVEKALNQVNDPDE
jgi:hypothetical protein